MIFPSNRVRIMVATKPVDFRKGHDGLAALQRARDKELRRVDSDAYKRAEGTGYARAETWSVGLWRDHESGPVGLHCPPPDHAIVLKLKSGTKHRSIL